MPAHCGTLSKPCARGLKALSLRVKESEEGLGSGRPLFRTLARSPERLFCMLRVTFFKSTLTSPRSNEQVRQVV